MQKYNNPLSANEHVPEDRTTSNLNGHPWGPCSRVGRSNQVTSGWRVMAATGDYHLTISVSPPLCCVQVQQSPPDTAVPRGWLTSKVKATLWENLH